MSDHHDRKVIKLINQSFSNVYASLLLRLVCTDLNKQLFEVPVPFVHQLISTKQQSGILLISYDIMEKHCHRTYHQKPVILAKSNSVCNHTLNLSHSTFIQFYH